MLRIPTIVVLLFVCGCICQSQDGSSVGDGACVDPADPDSTCSKTQPTGDDYTEEANSPQSGGNSCGQGLTCTVAKPCCSENKKYACCDKITKGCCANYGCVDPCESIFDAVGCELSYTFFEHLRKGPSVKCPSSLTKLYRILRPDEDCNKGLLAKDIHQTRTVLSHVNCGSRKNYKSQFISCTSSLEVAEYYKDRFEVNDELRIAEMNLSDLPKECKEIDLTKDSISQEHLGNAVCKNFAKASCEVLLQCGDNRVFCRTLK